MKRSKIISLVLFSSLLLFSVPASAQDETTDILNVMQEVDYVVVYDANADQNIVTDGTFGGNEYPEAFDAYHVEDLKQKISLLWDNDTKIVEFGQNARKKAELEFSPEPHYKKMMNQYEHLLSG